MNAFEIHITFYFYTLPRNTFFSTLVPLHSGWNPASWLQSVQPHLLLLLSCLGF